MFEDFGVAEDDGVAFAALDADAQVADEVLSEVDDGAARGGGDDLLDGEFAGGAHGGAVAGTGTWALAVSGRASSQRASS
nr:hypothetical protein GCM10025732_26170 [Glycomyces mayteni]